MEHSGEHNVPTSFELVFEEVHDAPHLRIVFYFYWICCRLGLDFVFCVFPVSSLENFAVTSVYVYFFRLTVNREQEDQTARRKQSESHHHLRHHHQKPSAKPKK